MKKTKKRLILAFLSVLLVLSLSFASFGCGEKQPTTPQEPEPTEGMKYEGNEIAGFKLPHSAGQASDEFFDYNSEIFYLNETRLDGADPGALYVSNEDAIDSYEKLMHSWQYKDENGAWQWQKGKSEQSFIAENGTLEEWVAEYGNWYYMIVTGYNSSGAFALWRSHDLISWEPAGRANAHHAIEWSSKDWCNMHFWAPEFMRDPASGLYFIFFSANSKNGNANTTYGPNSASTGYDFDGLNISCAISDNPLGPYKMATTETYYNFRAKKDESGRVVTGKELVPMADLNMDGIADAHAYELYDSEDKVIGYFNNGLYYNLNGYVLTNENPMLSIGYYYMRLATNEKKVQDMLKVYSLKNIGINLDMCLFPAIDVNPVIASDGTMMLYFSQHISKIYKANAVWCIKMKDWLSPDWDTLTHISTPGYVTVYQDGSFEGQWEYKMTGSYEDGTLELTQESNLTSWNEGNVNEGTEVLEHNGKWYFTYSPFGYGSRSYSPYVAVSDKSTGPFIKLGLDYSPIIGIGTEYNNYMSGTGHHVFIKAGEELWILYHCFYNPENNQNGDGGFLGRCIGVDRAYWKYTPELGYDMLYGNGPTYNLQPKPETYTGYTNVAKYATIEGTGDIGDVEVLTDGLFTSQPFTRHWEYGSTSGQIKIKLTWDKPMEITAFHIYNSGSIFEAFKRVNSVMFKLAEKPAWYQGPETQYCYIKDLAGFADDYMVDNRAVRKGAAAIAEFNPIKVTEMTICITATMDNDNKYYYTDKDMANVEYTQISLAELYVMGKPVSE